MDKIKEALLLLKEKRPSVAWLLSRFLLCFFGANFIIHAIALFAMVIVPFATLLVSGSFIGFLMWFFAPVSA